ncbi:peroxisome proliferator-activated receptor delta-like [Babylonia areolata]|uniref:peroxisome proliferator-activated receptor delta-like n=1 Tax=Babylonia areolata TaxID=304850 RepID=UPI003FCF52AA
MAKHGGALGETVGTGGVPAGYLRRTADFAFLTESGRQRASKLHTIILPSYTWAKHHTAPGQNLDVCSALRPFGLGLSRPGPSASSLTRTPNTPHRHRCHTPHSQESPHRRGSMLLPEASSLLGSWHHSEPVDLDPDSAMCLEVFAGMDSGRETAPGTADCQSLSSVDQDVLGPSVRRYSTPGSSPSSYDFCASRSPHALSDSGKSVKPQYTAELDVLCRICGDRASGFHYGVHSCEGCKGFFRRTLKKQLVYKPCQMGNQCKIDAGTRNKCQYCRYQRCLNAGMSQDAVRFGRMPKTEREKLMADKEELSSTNTKRIVELRSLTDLIKAAFRDVFHATIFFTHPDTLPSSSSSSSSLPPSSFAGMGMGVLQSLSAEEFQEREVFWHFQEVLLPVLEASVKFAKRLPGFTALPMPDQIELMKQNGFMVVHLAMHTIVDNELIKLDSATSSLRINRHSPRLCEQLQKLLQRTLAVGDRLRSMRLTHGELALFAAVLLTSERPGLNSPRPVEALQGDLIEALRLDLKHNHPKDRLLLPKLLVLIPDLVQIVEEFCDNLRAKVFDTTPDFAKTKPLLREIFDLCG